MSLDKTIDQYIAVRDKKTGCVISIYKHEFHPYRHEMYTAPSQEQQDIASVPAVEPALPVNGTTENVNGEVEVETKVVPDAETPVVTGEERFKELKARKAWAIPELKDEYYSLREQYGK